MTQHSMRPEAPPDPRARAELAHGASRDPIERHRRYLEIAGWINEDSDPALHEEVDRELGQALECAERSPLPPAEAALEGVCAS